MKQLDFYNKEFEDVVRCELLIYDMPITEDDALLVWDLDCSNFTFNIEDCGTLVMFKNLEKLSINISFENFSFLSELINLEELSIEFYGLTFDTKYLLPLKKLKSVFISGGIYSSFIFHNFDCISELPNLEDLSLHEFGTVDLAVLKKMPYLKGFYCGYADKVKNIDAISSLSNLVELALIDVTVKNLVFLQSLKKILF